MKSWIKGVAVFFVLLLAAFCVFLFKGPSGPGSDVTQIDHWQITWTDQFDPQISKEKLEALGNWTEVKTGGKFPLKPHAGMSQWIKIQLPELTGNSLVILIDKIYGRHIVVNVDGVQVYESQRKFNYSINSVLVPITAENSKQTVYIGVSSETKKIGIFDEIKIGHYQGLMKDFVRGNIADLIVGSTLIFIAVIMLVCSIFLKYVNMPMWFSLCAVIFSSGLLVLTYSPFVFWLFDHKTAGRLLLVLFDLSLFTLLPSVTLFFEKIFGPGYYALIRRSRKFLVVYSIFCFLVLIINELSGNRFYAIYSVVTVQLVGYIMIAQFVILACTSMIYVVKGNKEAVIFVAGFLIFLLFCVGDLLWYYYNAGYYKLFLWKLGVVCFLTSLIIILGRRFAVNHEQVVEYSKQLEMFNNELQRSEKMEIISELAASVAHEVRNPLQVTRGFLQLLAEKQQNSDKVYLNMALEELDRASGIITDFLTFAKPEAGKVTTLNVLDEFIHIEGILIPLANLQGGKISVHIPKNLYVQGNSSKFKQAFINIIKNSIEALNGEGEILIWGYEKEDSIVIHIKDNGEGMDKEVLARLGEPYFSNKTKGTGLGLMVTFRIIEVMNGEIHFTSEKGAGTEVVIRFPSVNQEEQSTE
ncbi:sensor histidine kinase [Paenibacillus macerans]|uniref:sensor histidine kinase n=1 Tax=Paenibacillus macerans TaxID=44252 RepID=UPI00203F6B7B|nr:sensor histidine kinase [Paenibacillus macerans]MCM3700053.1 sensor histidine kinase [Paenibacillus macerans]